MISRRADDRARLEVEHLDVAAGGFDLRGLIVKHFLQPFSERRHIAEVPLLRGQVSRGFLLPIAPLIVDLLELFDRSLQLIRVRRFQAVADVGVDIGQVVAIPADLELQHMDRGLDRAGAHDFFARRGERFDHLRPIGGQLADIEGTRFRLATVGSAERVFW